MLYLYYHKTSGDWTWQGGELLKGAFTHEVMQLFNHVVFWDHVTNQKRLISTTTVPEVAKVNSVVTQSEGLSTIKSDDLLQKWLCEVTWQISMQYL